jgi:hypothetical protein
MKTQIALALGIILSASVHAYADSDLHVLPLGNKMTTYVHRPAPEKLSFSTREAAMPTPCRRELRLGGNKMTSLELACPARRSDATPPLS